MRILFFLIFFFFSSDCFAQSLKDSLFGGKLKVDSALLIRSKVNLQKTEIDSTRKSQSDSAGRTISDSLQKQNNLERPVISYQDNNKIWKKFIDQYSSVIKSETLPSKKIRKGTYSVMIEYEIGTDGVVTIKNVTSIPSNEYLVEQIKEKMMPAIPQLAPLISNGVPRKSLKRTLIVFDK